MPPSQRLSLLLTSESLLRLSSVLPGTDTCSGLSSSGVPSKMSPSQIARPSMIS